MQFLKQLDLDVETGSGSNKGKQVVVWDETALRLLQEIEEEQNKRDTTNYKKILQKIKPRPEEIIRGKKSSGQLFEFAEPF